MSVELDTKTWERVTFREVVANINDYFDVDVDGVLPYVAGPHINPGERTVARYGSTDDDQFPPTFKRKFQQDDVLLHSRGIDKLAAVDRVGVTGEKLFVLRSKDENTLTQPFLAWLLQSPKARAHMQDNFTGSVNKFLNWNSLAAMEFDLPHPDEQKRIADVLWAVERRRLAISQISCAVDAAVNVRLREVWKRDRDKHAIGDIAECVTGSTPSKSNPAYWNSEDVPFYTPSEIASDTVRLASQRVSQAGAAIGRLLPKYAVAVACIGGDMGKSAVIAEPGISNQQITSIVGLQKDDAYALQSLLAHSFGRAAMKARETTTIVRKLNKSDLMKVEVPWPEDRAALRELISDRRAATTALSAEIATLKTLCSSLLADIFGGK
jgi:restriction endonuclease S subunit